MASPEATLQRISSTNGFLGACLVDSDTGMMMASLGGGVDLELASAGNTEVVRAKRRTMQSLGLDDRIDDILITLGRQYHLIRPLTGNDAVFVYLVLDKERANLAMARHQLAAAEKELVF